MRRRLNIPMSKLLKPADRPITEDDAFIAKALESASIPVLQMAMTHILGDRSVLDGELRPQAAIMGETQGFMSADDKAAVRSRALEVLCAYRDAGCVLPPPPDDDMIHEMMCFMVGGQVPRDYVPMMLEELALDGIDRREVTWEGTSVPARKDFHVLVIGAGMSGLLAAIKLEAAGIGYTIVEKNEGIGGTWYENTYPGCRVDIANHFYCYSFEPNHDWSQFYSQQKELRAYFEHCADKYHVRDNIRFGEEVIAANYDEDAAVWDVVLRDRGGAETEVRANAVVSAVGQLNRPKIPDFDGLEQFKGRSWHSADWPADADLSGKRVAVVGSGASAFQLVPEVAKTAAHLSVFQRSAPWMFPNPSYHRDVSDGMKWLLKHVPYYARWYRFLLFWPASDGLLPSLVIDPDWPNHERSINEANEMARGIFLDWMKSQVGDDAELLAKVTPDYPPFGKRMLQDNGSWLGALKRDNVDLITDGIDRIAEDAIVTSDGRRHEVDVIVFATGFHASKFLWPIAFTGRGGRNLGQLWGDDPKAYLGITVPGFPNLFCLYGPATNLAHAGSIIFHSECQVRYMMAGVKALLANGKRAMDCKTEVNDAFNEKLDLALKTMVWSLPAMDSWYKNSKGRVTATSPWRLLDYWNWTKEPSLADYDLS
jgi:4-hydroxyacetophenone monooxygenase